MANNLRDKIQETLTEAFVDIRDNAPAESGKPVQVASVLERFTLPTDLDASDLPAVSFGYGGSRLISGAFTQEEQNIYTINIFSVVPELPGMDLLASASAMEETVRLIVQDLNGYQITYEDNHVLGVSLRESDPNQTNFRNDNPATGQFTKYEFVRFRLEFQVAYEIPLDSLF